jgi:hypothetical protein
MAVISARIASTNEVPPSPCWPSGQGHEEAQRLPERKRILSTLGKFQAKNLNASNGRCLFGKATLPPVHQLTQRRVVLADAVRQAGAAAEFG